MIAQRLKCIKDWSGKWFDQLIALAIACVVGIVGFGIGRVAALEEKILPIKQPVRTFQYAGPVNASSTQLTKSDTTQLSQVRETGPPAPAPAKAKANEAPNFVASKNGTKYYPVDCKAAQRIKDANKVWFGTAKEAQNAGYEAASRCK